MGISISKSTSKSTSALTKVYTLDELATIQFYKDLLTPDIYDTSKEFIKETYDLAKNMNATIIKHPYGFNRYGKRINRIHMPCVNTYTSYVFPNGDVVIKVYNTINNGIHFTSGKHHDRFTGRFIDRHPVFFGEPWDKDTGNEFFSVINGKRVPYKVNV